MASADLKSFIENRLLALDPTLDISSGSPAQQKFILPLLEKLGTDPFETDIVKFLTDRYAQEFPDIYAANPSAIQDTFAKPLRLLLEPFKRETNVIRIGQSLAKPELLSDEEADSLMANIFEERSTGGYAVGTGRVFFPNPTNIQLEITDRFFTPDGLSFYPTSPLAITAEQMAFQRQGNLFFMDVPLRADKPGAEYNIPEDTLSGVEGVFGAIRVTNPRKFSDGSTKVDTVSFVTGGRQGLTEQSLVTRRGATSRLGKAFQGNTRAIQVIGARDPEMRRDLLVAISPGHAWLTGRVSLYDKVAYVQCRTFEGGEADLPKAGDGLYVYLDRYSYAGRWAGLAQTGRFLRLTVEEVLTGPMEESAPFQVSFFVRFGGDFPASLNLPNPAVLEGGFTKKGTIQVSSVPKMGAVSFSVPNGEVHVLGHSDIYVRPVLQPVSKTVLSGVTDYQSLVERVGLWTTAGSNMVTDPGFDFLASGVKQDHLLVIETGEDAGSYPVARAENGQVFLTQPLSKTDTTGTLRYRIQERIRVDLFEPKIFKFPFGNLRATDLSTTIGSNLFRLAENDLFLHAVKVGDVLRVKSGIDAGDFTIIGFDAALGGRGVLVDRKASGTSPSVSYEVFTPLQKVERPLVRIRQLLLLDSANQSTGITIPPAEPVAVVPTGDMTAARVRGASQRKSAYVLPDMADYIAGGSVAAPSGDRRYSLGFDPSTRYRSVQFPNGAYAEIDLRADALGACRYVLLTSESADDAVNFPPVEPRPGECLTLKNGPNQGSYLIEEVVKFQHVQASGRKVWSYFVKVYGGFPVDVFRQLITFLDTAEAAGAVGAGVTKVADGATIAYPDFFETTFAGLGAKLHTALSFYGTTSPGASALQAMVENLTQVEYEWGDPARGVLRTYFTEPTLFEQRTGGKPTLFSFKTPAGETLHYRPDPRRYLLQEVLPARIDADAELVDLPRNLDTAYGVGMVALTGDGPTALQMGVREGDMIAIHAEVASTSVSTLVGSTKVTSFDPVFSKESEGNLLFLEDGDDVGGYRVASFLDASNVLLDRPLSKTDMGVSVRMYDDVPTEFTIQEVVKTPGLSVLVTGEVLAPFGTSQPYRIYRKDVRRVTPTEMEAKKEGSLFYFDTEVVSLAPQAAANIERNSYLTLSPGTYWSQGYRHVVGDSSLTYSMQETGFLDLPTSILPVGVADAPENYLNLNAAPLQVSYERAEIVQQFQEFLDSPQDRVTAANMLARHFLPAYVSYDATYSGGSAPSVIAKDVLSYIDTLPVEMPLDVSEIQNCITRRGGNPKTPTRAILVIHDWDRRRWAEFSEDEVGGTTTRVPYNGTPRVSYFVPGPDVSGQDDVGMGERIRLIRL